MVRRRARGDRRAGLGDADRLDLPLLVRDGLQRLVRPRTSTPRSGPSGRSPRAGSAPTAALAVAAGLGAAGLGVAAARRRSLGRRGRGCRSPLLVVAYDAVAKDAAAGPLVMASTRGLDVLLGAHASPASAWQPALAMAAHTAGLTWLSRGEVHGTRPERRRERSPQAPLAVAAATAHAALRDPHAGRLAPHGRRRPVAAAYAVVVGRAQARAAQRAHGRGGPRRHPHRDRRVLAAAGRLARRAGAGSPPPRPSWAPARPPRPLAALEPDGERRRCRAPCAWATAPTASPATGSPTPAR